MEDRAGRLPLLAPMSDIAGRLSMQYATTLLHQPQGGKGILLGGVPAAKRGRVVVLGGGVAGGNSALVAAGLGAEVIVFDKDRDKLVAARAMGANVTGLYPHVADVADAVREADVVIGAVLVTGARAPHVVSADMVRTMEAGSVIVDISVDQGGCIETTRPTSWEAPTYQWEGVTHFCVTNMPGSVPRTSSQALSAAIAPFAVRLADGDVARRSGSRPRHQRRRGQSDAPGAVELISLPQSEQRHSEQMAETTYDRTKPQKRFTAAVSRGLARKRGAGHRRHRAGDADCAAVVSP